MSEGIKVGLSVCGMMAVVVEEAKEEGGEEEEEGGEGEEGDEGEGDEAEDEENATALSEHALLGLSKTPRRSIMMWREGGCRGRWHTRAA